MKVRTGFVSNSSSSSFILIVDKDIFDKEFYEIELEPIKRLISELFELKTIFNKEVAIYKNMTNMGGHGLWDEEVEDAQCELREEDYEDDDDYYDASEELYEFIKRLEEKAGEGNYLSERIDM
jgi:hypothetical protein